jgi:hypothetical protein
MAVEKTAYVMGRSPSETQRLQAQEKVFGRDTEQLLRLAGIRQARGYWMSAVARVTSP